MIIPKLMFLANVNETAAERTAVSCAAGRRLERGGQRGEAAARQCACGRPLEREERGVGALV